MVNKKVSGGSDRSANERRFRLVARVSTSSPEPIRRVLVQALGAGSLKEEGDSIVIEAEMHGESAKDLNRSLLSTMRRVEKKTRLRAQWTSDDGTTERFFDYVLKKKTRESPP